MAAGAEPALATLAAGAAAGVGLTGHPLGVDAMEATGSASLFPQVVGQVALGLAAAALLAAVVSLPRSDQPTATRWRTAALLAVPGAGYAAWLLGYAVWQPGPARLQAQLDLVLPAGCRHGRGRWRWRRPWAGSGSGTRRTGWQSDCWSSRC